MSGRGMAGAGASAAGLARASAVVIAGCLMAAPAVAQEAPQLPAAGLGLPVNLGGPFALTDQHGVARTQADPDGNLQLLFFGYANCLQICSAALPQMADVADALVARGIAVTPVMITVDAARDTPEVMAEALGAYSPDFVGLTGDAAALGAAHDAFQIETVEVFHDPEYGPVYAHGSFIFVLDGAGTFLTALPPILPTNELTDIVAGYAS